MTDGSGAQKSLFLSPCPLFASSSLSPQRCLPTMFVSTSLVMRTIQFRVCVIESA
jgi:hypothetical protein